MLWRPAYERSGGGQDDRQNDTRTFKGMETLSLSPSLSISLSLSLSLPLSLS
jgi:hypothetical protein